jgi:hypothetical protein
MNNWYCLNKNGEATLCTNQADADHMAHLLNVALPEYATHRAVQLVEVQPAPATDDDFPFLVFEGGIPVCAAFRGGARAVSTDGINWTKQPAPVQEPVDGMGMPSSCGKPLCSPGDHHPLCKLANQPAAPVQKPVPCVRANQVNDMNVADIAQPAPVQVAAVKTLEHLGYTYHGAELWKPPIGKPAPVREPVAYMYHDAATPQSANPLLHSTMLVFAADRRPELCGETPLYTYPPAAQQSTAVPVTLTEEQIESIYTRYGGDMINCARAIERAVIVAQKDSAAHDGWQLVPVDATDKMRRAAASAYLDTHGYADSWINAVYKAMLAAAPKKVGEA